MNGGSEIPNICPIVLILSIIRIAILNFNFIKRKEVSRKSKIKILEDFSIVELAILCMMNAWITENSYSVDLNFSITKLALKILILLTIGIVIKTIIKNFKLLANEDKKKVWLGIHAMSIVLLIVFFEVIGGAFVMLFAGIGYPYIHLMVVVNIFFIIEFI